MVRVERFDLTRLTKRDKNHLAKMHAPWAHAIQRMRERHDPAANQMDLMALGVHCCWICQEPDKHTCADSWGAVMTIEKPDSYVVQVRYKGKWIRVVYSPPDNVIRTVLPGEYPTEHEK